MELEVQFQIFFMSILFGMYLLSFWQFLNRLFLKKIIIRFFFELLFFTFNFLFYYFLLFKLNGGVFNIYLILGLSIGFFIHQKYYAPKILLFYEFILNKLNAIIKKTRRVFKRNGKNKKRKKHKEVSECYSIKNISNYISAKKENSELQQALTELKNDNSRLEILNNKLKDKNYFSVYVKDKYQYSSNNDSITPIN